MATRPGHGHGRIWCTRACRCRTLSLAPLARPSSSCALWPAHRPPRPPPTHPHPHPTHPKKSTFPASLPVACPLAWPCWLVLLQARRCCWTSTPLACRPSSWRAICSLTTPLRPRAPTQPPPRSSTCRPSKGPAKAHACMHARVCWTHLPSHSNPAHAVATSAQQSLCEPPLAWVQQFTFGTQTHRHMPAHTHAYTRHAHKYTLLPLLVRQVHPGQGRQLQHTYSAPSPTKHTCTHAHV